MKSKRKILMCIAIVLLTAIIFGMDTYILADYLGNDTLTYLYDSRDIGVTYNVSEIVFDLSTNHLYYYYKDDIEYDKFMADVVEAAQIFIDDDENMSREEFIAALQKYYPAAMISALGEAYAAYFDVASDEDSTTAQIRAAYNTYIDAVNEIEERYQKDIRFPFPITEIDISPNTDVWITYARSIVSIYTDEFTTIATNEDIDILSVTELNFHIRLKGGTTFSNNRSSLYYDKNFQTMVMPLTMRFINSGRSLAYLYSLIETYVDDSNDDSKGMMVMLIPQNTDWSSFTGDESPHEGGAKSLSDIADYREFIATLLYTAIEDGLIGTTALSPEGQGMCGSIDLMQGLSFADLLILVKAYNEVTADSYSDEVKSVEPGIDDSEEFYFLMFADYQTCDEEIYQIQYPGEILANGLEYYEFSCFYKMNLCISLREFAPPASLDEFDLTSSINARFQEEGIVGLSNFDVSGYIFFEYIDNESKTKTVSAREYAEHGYVLININDPNAVNYIENLRIAVRIKSYSPAYVRIRFVEELTDRQGNIIPVQMLKFNLADNWVDNRTKDMCLYSSSLYYSANELNSTSPYLIIGAVNGLDPDEYYDGSGNFDIEKIDEELAGAITNYNLKISVYVESVQPNRVEAYWGISHEQLVELFK